MPLTPRVRACCRYPLNIGGGWGNETYSDSESSVNVRVLAWHSVGGVEDATTVNVYVRNLQEVPMADFPRGYLDENTPNDTPIDRIFVTEADCVNPALACYRTYEVVSGNPNNAFQIVGDGNVVVGLDVKPSGVNARVGVGQPLAAQLPVLTLGGL